MSATINGVVEAVRRDGRGFRVGEEWYGVFLKSQLIGVDRGDEVSFTFLQNEKGFNNVQGQVEVVKSDKSRKTPTNLPDYDRQLMIIRQNALTNAVNYSNNFNDRYASIPEVIETAQKFEQYTSGKLGAHAAQAILPELGGVNTCNEAP